MIEKIRDLRIKRHYKKYLANKYKFVFYIDSDFFADFKERGEVCEKEFKSGNIYKLRFLRREVHPFGEWNASYYNGIYEMSNDIQNLSYEQFKQIHG